MVQDSCIGGVQFDSDGISQLLRFRRNGGELEWVNQTRDRRTKIIADSADYIDYNFKPVPISFNQRLLFLLSAFLPPPCYRLTTTDYRLISAPVSVFLLSYLRYFLRLRAFASQQFIFEQFAHPLSGIIAVKALASFFLHLY